MLNKKPAGLNRSLRLTEAELIKYSSQLINLTEPQKLKSVTNKIINQDILSAVKYLPENFVDLLFIDPPYNITKKFNRVAFREMNNDEYEVWLDSWLSKLIVLLKENSSIYICGDWKSSSAIFRVGSKYFQARNRITWEREKGRGAKANWKNCSEDIWFFTNSDTYTFNVEKVKLRRKVLAPYRDEKRNPKDWGQNSSGNFRDTFPSNIWNDISIPFWSMPENTEHPTQKPEKLLAKLIIASTNEGDFVFDPFIGSGTTAVVAKKLGRRYVGVEVDNYYCSLAIKRLELAEKNKKIQGYEDDVFWERNTLIEQVKSQKSKVKKN
ncbi:MAG: site-specific DNA-methyltransferase [Ignavibacteriaceae bacterium]|nr:site-specific DNA-methyltransferase [Ignavibacteriaceae bacterium]MCU0406172.1 site-specific DNA-methyltransferase [Ignavibacteriaceae bacterium]